MEITLEDINQILQLIDKSDFNELHLEIGDLRLDVAKNMPGGLIQQANLSRLAPQSVKATEPSKDMVAEQDIERAKPQTERVQPQAPAAVKEGLVPIKSPMIGTFYRRPEPGSPPYVDIGSYVEENTTVCLLEVMKVFSAVRAGVRGYIREVCAESGDLVEYGQILFWVEPKIDKAKEEE